MDISRRNLLLLGLSGAAAYLTGCANQTKYDSRPPVPWSQGKVAGGGPRPPAPPQPVTPKPPTGLTAIPRSYWAKAPPLSSKLVPLGPVYHITVHHEGWTVVDFSDTASTAARLDSIRRSHLERLGAADIGYHFVIDRAGRLWQGRELAYQGAHVKNNNPNNIGIMVLGNFDKQQPTEAQIQTLRSTLFSLRNTYRLPIREVYTHQEINPTECPGTVLQAQMVALRRAGLV